MIFFEFSHGPLLDLGIAQLNGFRVGGAPHHGTQQDMSFRGALREDTRIPQGTEDLAAFLLGDQVAEAVQVLTDLLPLIAEADDVHRRVGDAGQQLRRAHHPEAR